MASQDGSREGVNRPNIREIGCYSSWLGAEAPQRPDTLAQDQLAIAECLLRRTAGPYIWVNCKPEL